MIDDIEKGRAEYVTQLELKVKHLQQQLSELQAKEKWIPEANMVMQTNEKVCRISLSFGGKQTTVALRYDSLLDTNTSTLTSAVLETMSLNLVNDRLREIVEPLVEQAQRGVKSIVGAGKW